MAKSNERGGGGGGGRLPERVMTAEQRQREEGRGNTEER